MALAGEGAFEVPYVRGAVRLVYPWRAGGRLLIGTVAQGLWSWRSGDAAPLPEPVLTTRVIEAVEWDGALMLASEHGLYRWAPAESAPQQIAGIEGMVFDVQAIDGALSFRSYPINGKSSGGDSEFVWRHGEPRPVTLGMPTLKWQIATWHGAEYFTNLQGLFKQVDGQARQVDSIKFKGAPGCLVASLDVLIVCDRDGPTYSLAEDLSAKVIGPKIESLRSTLSWDGRILLLTDNGVWEVARGGMSTKHVDGVLGRVWSGALPLGKDLLIGTTEGLYRWHAGQGAPVAVEPRRIGSVSSMGLWRGRGVVSASTVSGRSDLFLLDEASDEVEAFPLRFGSVDAIADWNDALVLGLDGGPFKVVGALAAIRPALLARGRIDIAPPASYNVGQPIYISWKISDSPVADLPEFFTQHVILHGADGATLSDQLVLERHRKSEKSTEFELTLPAAKRGGDHTIEIVARGPLGVVLRQQLALTIGGSVNWATTFKFLGWKRPETLGDAAKLATSLLSLLCGLYYIGVFLLFALSPRRLVQWHELLAEGRVPAGPPKWTVSFLLSSNRCLDAVVEHAVDRAIALFEHVDDVRLRPLWVPAPMIVGSESISAYGRPDDLRDAERYIPGQHEIRRALADGPRTILSIEGPGGVGKSALAFQIAHWAASADPASRLRRHRMLPMLLEAAGKSVDDAVRGKLRLILNAAKVSDLLFEALARKGRCLAIVDGISEQEPVVFKEGIRPEGGAKYVQAMVVTSRLTTALPDAVTVQPQELTLAFLDAMLDGMINRLYGAGRFSGEQRELIRTRLITVLRGLGGETNKPASIPLLVLSLMLQRADSLASDASSTLLELPASVDELVDGYVNQVLRVSDAGERIQLARRAARVCVGDDFIPSWRPLANFESARVSLTNLSELVYSGLMSASDNPGDPMFKFALDPIAEALAARDWAIQLRDGLVSRTEFDARVGGLGVGVQGAAFAAAVERYLQRPTRGQTA